MLRRLRLYRTGGEPPFDDILIATLLLLSFTHLYFLVSISATHFSPLSVNQTLIAFSAFKMSQHALSSIYLPVLMSLHYSIHFTGSLSNTAFNTNFAFLLIYFSPVLPRTTFPILSLTTSGLDLFVLQISFL